MFGWDQSNFETCKLGQERAVVSEPHKRWFVESEAHLESEDGGGVKRDKWTALVAN